MYSNIQYTLHYKQYKNHWLQTDTASVTVCDYVVSHPSEGELKVKKAILFPT